MISGIETRQLRGFIRLVIMTLHILLF